MRPCPIAWLPTSSLDPRPHIPAICCGPDRRARFRRRAIMVARSSLRIRRAATVRGSPEGRQDVYLPAESLGQHRDAHADRLGWMVGQRPGLAIGHRYPERAMKRANREPTGRLQPRELRGEDDGSSADVTLCAGAPSDCVRHDGRERRPETPGDPQRPQPRRPLIRGSNRRAERASHEQSALRCALGWPWQLARRPVCVTARP